LNNQADDNNENSGSETPPSSPENIDVGETRWEFTADAPFQEAGVSIDNNRVIATSDDETIYALSLESGEVEWTFSEDDWGSLTPFAIEESTVFLVMRTKMVAINIETGKERWQTDEATSPRRSPPLITEDSVYVHGGSLTPANNGVVELDRETGSFKWRVETDATSLATPALINGLLLVAVVPHGSDRSGRLLGLDAATGEERWRVDHDKPLGGIELHDGTAYVSGEDGPLLAVDAQTGDILWETNEEIMNNNLSGGNIVTTQAHIFDNRLFFNGEYVLEYDRETGERLNEIEQVEEPTRLFDRNGVLYSISAAPRDEGVYRIIDDGPAELLFSLNRDTDSLHQLKMGTFDANDYTLCVAEGSTLHAIWYVE
jgi:outer membrane protein assembly factor BamB